jgi:hypothetical protein
MPELPSINIFIMRPDRDEEEDEEKKEKNAMVEALEADRHKQLMNMLELIKMKTPGTQSMGSG